MSCAALIKDYLCRLTSATLWESRTTRLTVGPAFDFVFPKDLDEAKERFKANKLPMLHHFVFGYGGSMAARSGRTFEERRFKQRRRSRGYISNCYISGAISRAANVDQELKICREVDRRRHPSTAPARRVQTPQPPRVPKPKK
jgi:hypothetical protein